MNTDEAHMRAALALARRALGTTWPNPSVACILVKHGRVIARATTAPGGRPHAETAALDLAGPQAQGATAYVTLEPCSHHGHTPPCADALIAAGIARVVVGGTDPDPRVNGQGLARLRAAGIAVTTGILTAEADAQQQGFLTRIRAGRPMVTLKLATTLDGRIATASGESQWITGPESRRAAHALRGNHDATLVGINTALADDPALTTRIPGYRTRPDLRVVLDRTLRLPPTSQLAQTAHQTPLWIIHNPNPNPTRKAALESTGATLMEAATITQALQTLGTAGLTRILVEGGATIAAALLDANLVDHLAWFHAPTLLGHNSRPAIDPLTATTLAAMPRFNRTETHQTGPDTLTLLKASAPTQTHQNSPLPLGGGSVRV